MMRLTNVNGDENSSYTTLKTVSLRQLMPVVASYAMWMSNLFILVDQRNADRNTMPDIACAVEHVGGKIVNLDEQSYLIEAVVPTRDVPTIAAMEGVAYVRSVFTYIAGNQPEVAA